MGILNRKFSACADSRHILVSTTDLKIGVAFLVLRKKRAGGLHSLLHRPIILGPVLFANMLKGLQAAKDKLHSLPHPHWSDEVDGHVVSLF